MIHYYYFTCIITCNIKKKEMSVSNAGVFNAEIVGAVVELNVRYHQSVFVAAVCNFYREP